MINASWTENEHGHGT